MQQSTRWSSPSLGSRLLAGAAVLVLVCAPAPTALAGGGDDAGTADEAAAGSTADALLRPHWIEPRRGDGPVASDAAPAREWRADSHIVVHALADRTPLATLVEETLGKLGAEDVERRTVDMTASTDQVRFFHAEDAVMAAELAASLEPLFDDAGGVRVRDLTFYRPLPERGVLEVWLR